MIVMSDFRIKDEQLKELGDYLKKVRESKDYSQQHTQI